MLKLSYLKFIPMIMMILAGATQPWAASTATEIYFVRHAETVSNATAKYSLKNDRMLSRDGKKQVRHLTRQLQQLDIDHIIVGPQHRALITILPFLKQHHRTAEIWPSLDECCWQKKQAGYHSGKLKFGSKIELTTTMKPYFEFPDTHAHFRFYTQSYEEGIAQVNVAADKILRRFGNSGKRILVIGDFHSGTRIIELLQGLKPEGWYKLSNAKIIQLKENRHGYFVLKSNI